MKINPAIEPDIQEEILNLLPDPPEYALKLLAQLTGNMLANGHMSFADYVNYLTKQYFI